MWPKENVDEEKFKMSQFGSATWFWPSNFPQDAEAGKRHSRA
jgi:hypothetical protein